MFSVGFSGTISKILIEHDDVIKWKHFPRNWPFVRGVHRSPLNFHHKGQRRGALLLSLIGAWINGWVNNRDAGDLRRHRAHYNVTVMNISNIQKVSSENAFEMLSAKYRFLLRPQRVTKCIDLNAYYRCWKIEILPHQWSGQWFVACPVKWQNIIQNHPESTSSRFQQYIKVRIDVSPVTTGQCDPSRYVITWKGSPRYWPFVRGIRRLTGYRGSLPSQMASHSRLNMLFDVKLNQLLNKLSNCRRFETLAHIRHCYVAQFS